MFYEPHGITLRSADDVAERSFKSAYMNGNGWTDSVVFMNHDISTPHSTEENPGEATAAITMVKALLNEGWNPDDIAVITPFRKQVRLLRETAHELIPADEWPLIDTVERLQGQDVECIILTFAASDKAYINQTEDFLFNPNRLNVMISRAKTKVIIFASKIAMEELNYLK